MISLGFILCHGDVFPDLLFILNCQLSPRHLLLSYWLILSSCLEGRIDIFLEGTNRESQNWLFFKYGPYVKPGSGFCDKVVHKIETFPCLAYLRLLLMLLLDTPKLEETLPVPEWRPFLNRTRSRAWSWTGNWLQRGSGGESGEKREDIDCISLCGGV